ncbi:MAG: amidase, partial [Egibacteraceae bacterium]
GLAPVVTASDGAGSIRIPASNCGLFGLKPSRGRISNGPLFGDSLAGLSTPGPLTRHVADAAALLDAMRGYATGDPHWAPEPVRPYVEEVAVDPPPLRLALVTQAPYGAPTADALRVVDEAARLLERLGHTVEPVEVPPVAALKDDFEMVWAAGMAAAPLPLDTLEPFNRGLAEQGQTLSAGQLLGAVTSLQLQARLIVGATARYDAVLSPTLLREPLAVGELREVCTEPGQWQALLDALATYVGLTPVANVTGQPSMNLPLGWSGAGLPMGVMVTGRPADEATLLRLAAQTQRAADWTTAIPPRQEEPVDAR